VQTSRRAVIFANGLLGSPETALRAILPDDILIAADGGARHCRRLGLTPHFIVGDFDSLEPGELQAFQDTGVVIFQHPARKDFTDLELALRHARSLGVAEILILGGLGARWDQTLANLLLPASQALCCARITLVDGAQEIHLLRGGEQLELQGDPGDIVSLIPLKGDAVGVATGGLEYPLAGETLFFGSTRGVSNVLLAEPAWVSLQGGLLLCVLVHKM